MNAGGHRGATARANWLELIGLAAPWLNGECLRAGHTALSRACTEKVPIIHFKNQSEISHPATFTHQFMYTGPWEL